MDALQPSFMLLPDFSFLPNKDIRLGSILPMTRDTKRPNPRQPLTAAFTLIADDISTQEFIPWKWDSDNSCSIGGGVFADLSIITGVGAGVEGSRSHSRGLAIECERVVQTTFRPSQTSIARAASDQMVSSILKKLVRPSIFIVTGVMVAHGAKIEVKKGQSHSGGAHASADVTQVGVPVNAGVKGEVSNEQNSTLVQAPKEDLVLAYQLLRVRRKFDRSLDAVEENRWALFNDDGDDEGENELVEELELDQVTEGFQWEDGDDDE
jgi:hypothetical protein